ncbi:MAG: hypothetical protein LKI18_03060 [Prevotella sp.]|jgi:uncharacterized protein YcfL|nr:hypothetical protein [Prevotella sp.]
MSKKKIISLIIFVCLLTACSQENYVHRLSESSTVLSDSVSSTIIKEDMQNFASILSKAVYQNEGIRSFLKEQSIKQFDKNYDILYYPVRNTKVDGERTFRNILVSYSSEQEISKIERV